MDAVSPFGVVTLLKESTTVPPFSETSRPFVAGVTCDTSPRRMLPLGIATRPSTMTGDVVVAVKSSPTWLVPEPTGVDSMTSTVVPSGTVSRVPGFVRATGVAGAGRASRLAEELGAASLFVLAS
jgi:hypothetical protein